jgi:hypothetical protein
MDVCDDNIRGNMVRLYRNFLYYFRNIGMSLKLIQNKKVKEIHMIIQYFSHFCGVFHDSSELHLDTYILISVAFTWWPDWVFV